MPYKYKRIESPVGPLYLIGSDSKLNGIYFCVNWPDAKKKFQDACEGDSPVFTKAEKQLSEYFSGERKEFSLPLDPIGTEFQKKAWFALQDIPYGKTSTYKAQAEAIKSPLAMRAVGRANGLNPLCIVLPCHRVVGSDGSLTGFAGGLDTKEFLLRHEDAF